MSCLWLGSVHRKNRLRMADRLNKAAVHLDLIHVEEIGHLELCDDVHSELGQQIIACIESHVPHAGPDGNQPRVVELRFLRHLLLAFITR